MRSVSKAALLISYVSTTSAMAGQDPRSFNAILNRKPWFLADRSPRAGRRFALESDFSWVRPTMPIRPLRAPEWS